MHNLLMAASTEDKPVDLVRLQALLDEGTTVDALWEVWRPCRTYGLMTPLQTAVLYSELPVIEFLLDRGANIDALNSTGKTAFLIHRGRKWERKQLIS